MELLWSGVSLDVLLLVLALAAFVAGLVAIFREDAAPEVVEDAKSESVSQSESTPKAREDLPEPEPEGEEERCLEATLERLPGEAWGLAWNKVAYAQQRLLVAAVDPNSPAGRWQQERKAQGLPTLELGDELISANDVTQHSSMQITLVVANQLHLKFLRDPVVPGQLEKQSETIFEAKFREKLPLAVEEPSSCEDEIEENTEFAYDRPLNFWSYQRPPRVREDTAASTSAQSPKHLRARSDPPRARSGSTSPGGETPLRTTPSRGAGLGLAHFDKVEEKALSSGSGSENSEKCPSTDWEYMMDNRAGQQAQAIADAGVVVVGQAFGTLPFPVSSMPDGQKAEAHMPGAMVPMMSGFHPGMYPAQNLCWNYAMWPAAQPESGYQDWEIPRPSEGPNASPSARPEGPKKTYRAGQRITARRLRAAQREAETAAVDADANEDSNEEQTEGPRKPRRRAGVRVRRRREHALRRREAEALGEAEAPAAPAPVPAPVPAPAAPGPREKAKPLSEVAAGPGRRSLTSRPLTSRREKACEASHEAAAEQDIIGEKILVNGLQAPHLNGRWAQVTDFDADRGLYSVQLLGSELVLALRRTELVVPKTSPPAPQEIRTWQPNLRMT